MDVLEQAKATHSCPVCNATIESKQEEDLIDQHGHGHCADCEVQAVQGATTGSQPDRNRLRR